MEQYRGTTILAIKRNNVTVIAGDGQVTQGDTVMKGNARKVRRLYHDSVVCGFAGGTADAFTLVELFEKKLEKNNGLLLKSAVDMAKEWRTDKMLRKLEALLIVADKDTMLLLTGNGDVIEPEESFIAIGSGGNYARSAAKALVENTKLSAKEIALKSLKIASEICIYTNGNIIAEELSA